MSTAKVQHTHDIVTGCAVSDEFTEFYKNEIVPQIKKTLKDNNVTILGPNAINRSYKPVVNDHTLLQGQEYIGALSIILDMDKTGNNPLVLKCLKNRNNDSTSKRK